MNEVNMTSEQRADLMAYYFEHAHDSIAEDKIHALREIHGQHHDSLVIYLQYRKL